MTSPPDLAPDSTADPAAVPGDLATQPGRPPVLAVRADDAPGWVARHRAGLRALVLRHGALLVRGLGLRDPDQFGAVARAVADRLMTEREGFAARERIAEGVYGDVRWPADEQLCMHHELGYRLEFPGLLIFGCLVAPAEGGATAVADAAAVARALPAELVAAAARLGWQLTRNHPARGGLERSALFGGDDDASVAGYCRRHGLELTVSADGGLRTRQRRPGLIAHPVTGERVWFNDIAFLSEWTLDADVREYLISVYGPDGLPYATRYGDGSAVPRDVVTAINATYDAHTVAEPWRAGDLLLVDNVRMANARPAYRGPREVLVSLADPVRVADCDPRPAPAGGG